MLKCGIPHTDGRTTRHEVWNSHLDKSFTFEIVELDISCLVQCEKPLPSGAAATRQLALPYLEPGKEPSSECLVQLRRTKNPTVKQHFPADQEAAAF